MTITLVYKSDNDKKLLELSEGEYSINYIDINTKKGKKEGWKLMNYYGTTTFPFIEITKEDNSKFPLYSENGNAIYQLNNFINNDSKN